MASFTAPPQTQSSFQGNGVAVNKANLFDGLRRSSGGFKPTGTAGGDRAAQDFAKGMLYQNQAKLGLEAEKQNAQLHSQAQDQKEQLTQGFRQAALQANLQRQQQGVDRMKLGFRQATDQNEMLTQWRTGLIGLLS